MVRGSSTVLAATLATVAASWPTSQASFLQVQHGEPHGASTLQEALAAASDSEMMRVEDGVHHLEDLQDENTELQRRNQELEKRAAESEARAAYEEEHSPQAHRGRVLHQEIKDLQAKSISVDADQAALFQTVQNLMNTTATRSLHKLIDQADRSKLAVERDCSLQQQQLKQQMQNAIDHADANVRLAEQLQSQNSEMRHVAQELQDQRDDLQRNASSLRSKKERLEVALEGRLSVHDKDAKAKEARAEESRNTGLLDQRSQLVEMLKEQQELAAKLEGELRGERDASTQFRHQLQHSVKLAKKNDDGSAEIIQSLQGENADLRGNAEGARGEMKGLQEHVQSLEFDKENLVTTLQSTMRQGATVKNELKQKLAEKDKEIAQRDHQLVEQAKEATKPHRTPRFGSNRSATRVAPPSSSTTTVATTSTAGRTTTTRAPLPDDDVIRNMAKRAEMQHYQMEATEQRADAAMAVADGADDVTTTPTLPSPDHLDEYLAAAESTTLSPVDALDPDAVAAVVRRQAEAQDMGGDGVDALLRTAQGAVASP